MFYYIPTKFWNVYLKVLDYKYLEMAELLMSYCWAKASPISFPFRAWWKMVDAAEAGPEGDGVMNWMRTVMADPRWRSIIYGH